MNENQERCRKQLLAKIHTHPGYKIIKENDAWQEWLSLRFRVQSCKDLSIKELNIVLDILNNKLDLIKQFFTTLLVIDAGLFGFLFLNFEKNSWFLNFCAVCGIILVSAVFGFLLKTAIGILKEMKGLPE